MVMKRELGPPSPGMIAVRIAGEIDRLTGPGSALEGDATYESQRLLVMGIVEHRTTEVTEDGWAWSQRTVAKVERWPAGRIFQLGLQLGRQIADGKALIGLDDLEAHALILDRLHQLRAGRERSPPHVA